MSEQKKNWLRDFASIFVEIPKKEGEESTVQTTTNAPVSNQSAPVNASHVAVPQSFTEDLKARFQKILSDKNQAGFDFYEFSMVLSRSSTMPSMEHFRTAFESAKMMNPSCSKEFLLSSANFYKRELQTAYESTIGTGQAKKQSLASEKQQEQQQLVANLGDIDKRLAQLKQEIAALEQSRAEKQNLLSGIDQKFTEKQAEIDQKIQATAAAKQGVLYDLEAIENGINQYL